MRDLSMHVLDLVMNSIKANANLIEIIIDEGIDNIYINIKDNGTGMSKEMLDKVLDPFFTTRTTRRVGLGVSLFYDNVKKTNGEFSITSKLGEGTVIEASLVKSHIDCIPIGNIDETILSLILLEPNIDFIYKYKKNDNEFELNTIEIKRILDGVPINEASVLKWLKECLNNKFN